MADWLFLPGQDLKRQLEPNFEHLRLDQLEVDAYDSLLLRRRCGARAVVNLEKKSCHWCVPDLVDNLGNERFRLALPHDMNPEYAGATRSFQWLPRALQSNSIFAGLVSIVSRSLPLAIGSQIKVNMQIICYCPSGSTPALPTPNFVHRDNVSWTSITLLERDNITGGHFWVCTPNAIGCEIGSLSSDKILFDTDFDHVLDTIVMDDRMISHHVSAMGRANVKADSRRSILIVDYMTDGAAT